MKTTTVPSRVVDLGSVCARVDFERGKTKLTLMAPLNRIDIHRAASASVSMNVQQVDALIQALRSTLSARSPAESTQLASGSGRSRGMAQVTVATYEHNGGVDTRVFSHPKLAAHWKSWLAETQWEQKLPEESKPSRRVMANEYFDLVEGEYFEAQECSVETTVEVEGAANDSPHY